MLFFPRPVPGMGSAFGLNICSGVTAPIIDAASVLKHRVWKVCSFFKHVDLSQNNTAFDDCGIK
jgi:hypothetical protein